MHITERYSTYFTIIVVSINIWIRKQWIEYRAGNEKVIYHRGTVHELNGYTLLT